MWKCKNHMKVGRIDYFCTPLVYSDFFHDSLTVGTVTVAAGVVMELHMPAIITPANVITKFPGFTV